MSHSEGDPRVHFVMNLVLSVVFATVVVRALAFVGTLSFSWRTVAVTAGALMLLTYVVVR